MQNANEKMSQKTQENFCMYVICDATLTFKSLFFSVIARNVLLEVRWTSWFEKSGIFEAKFCLPENCLIW